MEKEIKENEKLDKAGIYYDAMDAYIPEDKLGENVLYSPSIDTTINVNNRINPFTNVIRDNIEIHNIFREYNQTTFNISNEIMDICTAYMANSIMMNAITIFEDPWSGSLINSVKGYIKREDSVLSQRFYTEYTDFINYSNSNIRFRLRNILSRYFENKSNGIITMNNESCVSFIPEVVQAVSVTCADEGQRFISNILINGSIDTVAFNSYLISLIENAPGPEMGKPFKPDDRRKMVDDNSNALTYLNISLDCGINKLSQISEAIAYSGLYYIKEAIKNIDWEKCNNRIENHF